MKRLLSSLLVSTFLLPSACGHPPGIGAGPAPAGATSAKEGGPAHEEEGPVARNPIESAIGASDRSESDRELDKGRKPEEMLRFFKIAPGQRVAELAAGGGYTAELLARVVGSEGKVYGQNTPFILERFAEKPWAERLEKPVMGNVVRVDSELEEPLPDEAHNLDTVLLVLFYHDTVWFETDRKRMNEAIFRALRPGGLYGIVDHSAKKGDGVTVAQSLHRIERSVVIEEVRAAGFVLDAEADFLRNHEDGRDWNASPSAAGEKRGQSDRFVLRFRKPESAAQEPPTAPKDDAVKQSALSENMVRCEEPRSPMCTREYRPVCAVVDTGVRCVRAPCPSAERKTYSNACTACADENVIGYEPEACPE